MLGSVDSQMLYAARLPADIEYSFASGLYGEELLQLQGACSCPITAFKVVYHIFGSFSWLIRM